jgi:apolipoprotein N-acyltransferase
MTEVQTQHDSRSERSWLYLLAAFTLLCFANGRWHLPVATWLAPIFLVLFIKGQPLRWGLSLGLLAQLLAFFVNWRGMIPVPGLWYYLVAGIYAVVYFLPFVVDRLCLHLLSGFRSTLILPLSWVTIEFLFQKFVTPYGSWVSLVYTQLDFLPLLQLVSITGPAGIHFMILWGAAVAAWAWRSRTFSYRIMPGVAFYIAVLLVLLSWGAYRIASAPDDAGNIRVVGITPSQDLTGQLQNTMNSLPASPAPDDPLLIELVVIAKNLNADLLERSRREAQVGAKIIVWSEHAARVTERMEDQLLKNAKALAEKFDVILVMGIGVWKPSQRYQFENKIAIVRPDAKEVDSYFKAHPIAGRESNLIEKGNNILKTFESVDGRFAAAICHDLDFPELIRTAGCMDALALMGPSADWAEITPFHARMAIVRAVENGCSLVRPCGNGLSLAADPLGRVIASQMDRGGAGNTLIVHVPLYRLNSLYPHAGDIFAYASIFALVLLTMLMWRSRQHR